MGKFNKTKLLFEIFKDQPLLKERTWDWETKYPDVNIRELKLEIINYQIMKYGEELKWVYERRFSSENNIKTNRSASARKRRLYEKKEIY